MKKIPKEMWNKTCKMGQGVECCRYMVMDPDLGIACGKGDAKLKRTLDSMNQMVAKGDNCDGI